MTTLRDSVVTGLRATLIVFLALALVGCGSEAEYDGNDQWTDLGFKVWQLDVTTTEGDNVTCIVTTTGTSCDWPSR
jgi:hypothetical protein